MSSTTSEGILAAVSMPEDSLVPPDLLALRQRLLEQRAELESELQAERRLSATPTAFPGASEARQCAERWQAAGVSSQDTFAGDERWRHIRCLPALQEFLAAREDALHEFQLAKANLVATRTRTSEESEQLKAQVAKEHARQGTLEAEAAELRCEADDLKLRLQLKVRSRQEADYELAQEAKSARAIRQEVSEATARRESERNDFGNKLRAALQAAAARGAAEQHVAAATAASAARVTAVEEVGARGEEPSVPSASLQPAAPGHRVEDVVPGIVGSCATGAHQPRVWAGRVQVHQPTSPVRSPPAQLPAVPQKHLLAPLPASSTSAHRSSSAKPRDRGLNRRGSSSRRRQGTSTAESDEDDELVLTPRRSDSMVGNLTPRRSDPMVGDNSVMLGHWAPKVDSTTGNLSDSCLLGNMGSRSLGVRSYGLSSLTEQDSSSCPDLGVASVSSVNQLYVPTNVPDDAKSDVSLAMGSDVSEVSAVRHTANAKVADARPPQCWTSFGSTGANSSSAGGALTTRVWKLANSLKPARSASKTSTGSGASIAAASHTSRMSNFTALGGTSQQTKQRPIISWLGRSVSGTRDRATAGADVTFSRDQGHGGVAGSDVESPSPAASDRRLAAAAFPCRKNS